jgi:glucosamine 6-phosphate synthetase-like amidotransferase/phosphosugar isomerase protein
MSYWYSLVSYVVLRENKIVEFFKIRTISEASNLLSPILAIVPLQMLSYHIAVRRGCDVDQPRNLAKSVTSDKRKARVRNTRFFLG